MDPELAKELAAWDLQPLFDSLAQDKLPSAKSQLKPAAEVVASILTESKPCAGAAAARKLGAELEALKKAVVHYEADGLEELKAETQAKITAVTDKLERAKKPTAELQRKDVVTLKAQFVKDAHA